MLARTDDGWSRPDGKVDLLRWHRLRKASSELESELRIRDRRHVFGSLVGSEDLRSTPIHRWFTYKEGFSPTLLSAVIAEFSLSDNLRVADVFGGVGTTALAGMEHDLVSEVRSVEYSPFAHFVGATKLNWPQLDTLRLRALLEPALAYDHQQTVVIPELSTLSRPEVFSRPRLRALIAARDHLRALPGASQLEIDFFLLGLAAVIEDLSGTMKDGRALRIKRSRTRRANSLAGSLGQGSPRGPVKDALASQWSAMIADLEEVADQRGKAAQTSALHVAGDARDLGALELGSGELAFPEGWADLSLFSPPYLNCIDYSEIYKLELWLMEHVVSAESFRSTRRGTLRSHPSVRFSQTAHFPKGGSRATDLAEGLEDWLTTEARRKADGVVVRQYFEDMFKVFQEQFRLLRAGGLLVCVVANSTFSRREKGEAESGWQELWRLPVLTDVLLAHFAIEIGFSDVEVVSARDLRPKNVKGGSAREALVVARK